jgi:hypothetical protein
MIPEEQSGDFLPFSRPSGDENVKSSPPSLQTRLVSGRQENWPAP